MSKSWTHRVSWAMLQLASGAFRLDLNRQPACGDRTVLGLKLARCGGGGTSATESPVTLCRPDAWAAFFVFGRQLVPPDASCCLEDVNMNTNLPKSDRPRTDEQLWLVKNCLELARTHKLFCPALLCDPPQRCDIDLRALQVLLRRAGVTLTPDEERELC